MYCTSLIPKPPHFTLPFAITFHHFCVFMYYCERKRKSKHGEGLGKRLALHTTPCCCWGAGQAESELANQTYRLEVKLSEADHVVGIIQWIELHTSVMYGQCEYSSPSPVCRPTDRTGEQGILPWAPKVVSETGFYIFTFLAASSCRFVFFRFQHQTYISVALSGLNLWMLG